MNHIAYWLATAGMVLESMGSPLWLYPFYAAIVIVYLKS